MSKHKLNNKKSHRKKISVFELAAITLLFVFVIFTDTEIYNGQRITRWELLMYDPKAFIGSIVLFLFIMICFIVIRQIKLE